MAFPCFISVFLYHKRGDENSRKEHEYENMAAIFTRHYT